ncbi:MAG: type II toxin-antitoxin system HicA family toxin [Deltaproteobacteria bacterium]|nr:type II toxin-antitoxin system HicA family toxin [Deltaproteobacteria bacterium]
MAKLPQISGKELCKILEKDGFSLARQTGSHRIYQKQFDDMTITIPVPVHSNSPLKKGTLLSILKKAGISREKIIFLMALLMNSL